MTETSAAAGAAASTYAPPGTPRATPPRFGTPRASAGAGPAKPYPGLASFQDTPEDRALFFAREQERAELLNLVLSEPLVVLFGRSGLGKSSLINARLIQDLRERRFLPVRVRLTYDPARGPTASLIQCVHAAVASEEDVAVAGGEGAADLWQFFHEARFTSGERRLRPVLILDQFEELFTIIGPESEWRAEFIAGLADVVRRSVPDRVRARASERLETLDRAAPERESLLKLLYEDAVPDVKVVISIREDYLAELHSLRSSIPFILRSSLRLEALTLAQAREAIEGPTRQHQLLGARRIAYSPGVVDTIIDQLRTRRMGRRVVKDERIEPLQLQIVCRFLDERRKGSPVVTPEHLRRWGGLRQAVAGYYAAVLRKFPRVRLGWNGRGLRPSFANLLLLNRPRSAIQRLCERGLIDVTGYRTSLIEPAVLRKFGVPPADLARLSEERLLRAEPRGDTVAYELSHDSLVGPLRATRKRRRRLRILGVVGTIVGLFLLVVVAERIDHSQTDLAAVEDGARSPAERGASFVELATHDNALFEQLRRGGLRLDGIDLRRQRLTAVRLDSAHLDSALLDGAVLDSARLRWATLTHASLVGASLVNARMRGADLRFANLAGADLRGAVLAEARLGAAIMDSARVDSTTLDGVDFSGTAWWLARGWTDAQVTALAGRFAPAALDVTPANAERFAAWARTIRQLAPARERFRRQTAAQAGDLGSIDSLTPALARLYNERAWFRVVRAADADAAALRAALADADSSLALLEESATLDTRSYVLTRLTWGAAAAPPGDPGRTRALRDIRAAIQLAGSDTTSLGEWYYHRGLALQNLGEDDEALKAFRKAAELRYAPTYERLFTPSTLAARAFAAKQAEATPAEPKKQ